MSRVVSLSAAAPYNLEATVRLLQRTPANRIDRWEDGRYQRAFQTSEGLRLVRVVNAGTVDEPDLTMEVVGGPLGDEPLARVTTTVRWVLGLDEPAAPEKELAQLEPRAANVLARLRGFRPPAFPTVFDTCLAVLPFQQLSLEAGTAIMGRMVERFGPQLTLDGADWFDFPAPEVIADADEADLVEAGLSRAKAVAIRRLAEHALRGDLNRFRFDGLSSADARVGLQQFPGIGPWSAGLILLRGMRRMDVFPAGDSGAARSLTRLLGLTSKLTIAEADAYADRFGGLRGYLYYLCLGNRLMNS